MSSTFSEDITDEKFGVISVTVDGKELCDYRIEENKPKVKNKFTKNFSPLEDNDSQNNEQTGVDIDEKIPDEIINEELLPDNTQNNEIRFDELEASGEVPEDDDEEIIDIEIGGFSIWIILIASAGGILLIGVILCVCWCCRSKKREPQSYNPPPYQYSVGQQVNITHMTHDNAETAARIRDSFESNF